MWFVFFGIVVSCFGNELPKLEDFDTLWNRASSSQDVMKVCFDNRSSYKLWRIYTWKSLTESFRLEINPHSKGCFIYLYDDDQQYVQLRPERHIYNFTGQVTRSELASHVCTTPFEYSWKAFPVRVEVCNNVVTVLPENTFDVHIRNQLDDDWTISDVVLYEPLRVLKDGQIPSGTQSGHTILKRPGIVRLQRETPQAFVAWQFDEATNCMTPDDWYWVSRPIEAIRCNQTITLTPAAYQQSILRHPRHNEICIDNQSFETWAVAVWDKLQLKIVDFDLQKMAGFQNKRRTFISPQAKLFHSVPRQIRNTTFSIKLVSSDGQLYGEFAPTETSIDCVSFRDLNLLLPFEFVYCNHTLTITQIDHIFCIENLSNDSWMAFGDGEDVASDNWYYNHDPMSVISFETIFPNKKNCYVLNKRTKKDQPFVLRLQLLGREELMELQVQHSEPQNENEWTTGELLRNSTWQEEPPYMLSLQDNTLTIVSRKKVKFCIDNQYFRAWAVEEVFDFDEHEWGVHRSPRKVLEGKEAPAEAKRCHTLYLGSPQASFGLQMIEDGTEAWFEARITLSQTETDRECFSLEDLKYSSANSSIEPVLCNNTLTLLPVIRGLSSKSCTHRVTTCKLQWQTVHILDNTLNDEKIEWEHSTTVGLTTGNSRSYTAENRTQSRTAKEKEKSSQQRSNKRVGKENEKSSQQRTNSRVGQETEESSQQRKNIRVGNESEQTQETRESNRESHQVGVGVETSVEANAIFVSQSVKFSINEAYTKEKAKETARGSRTSQRNDQSNEEISGSRKSNRKDESDEKTDGTRISDRNDQSNEETGGSRESETNEKSFDEMKGITKMIDQQFTWSRTITHRIEAGPFRQKKWQQKVLTCECYEYWLPRWRAIAMKDKNGSYTHGHRGRHRRAHRHTHLHHVPSDRCEMEDALRLISGSCDQHEECYHGRWVVRENPQGLVMVANDGIFDLRPTVKKC